jgi:hypothetical protein
LIWVRVRELRNSFRWRLLFSYFGLIEPPAKQLISYPEPTGVDHVSFAIGSNLLKFANARVLGLSGSAGNSASASSRLLTSCAINLKSRVSMLSLARW